MLSIEVSIIVAFAIVVTILFAIGYVAVIIWAFKKPKKNKQDLKII